MNRQGTPLRCCKRHVHAQPPHRRQAPARVHGGKPVPLGGGKSPGPGTAASRCGRPRGSPAEPAGLPATAGAHRQAHPLPRPPGGRRARPSPLPVIQQRDPCSRPRRTGTARAAAAPPLRGWGRVSRRSHPRQYRAVTPVGQVQPALPAPERYPGPACSMARRWAAADVPAPNAQQVEEPQQHPGPHGVRGLRQRPPAMSVTRPSCTSTWAVRRRASSSRDRSATRRRRPPRR